MITHITSLVCRGNPVTLEVKCLIQIKQLVQKEPPFHLSFEQVVHCHIGSPNVNPFFQGDGRGPSTHDTGCHCKLNQCTQLANQVNRIELIERNLKSQRFTTSGSSQNSWIWPEVVCGSGSRSDIRQISFTISKIQTQRTWRNNWRWSVNGGDIVIESVSHSSLQSQTQSSSCQPSLASKKFSGSSSNNWWTGMPKNQYNIIHSFIPQTGPELSNLRSLTVKRSCSRTLKGRKFV
jgi:hypothetical protein